MLSHPSAAIVRRRKIWHPRKLSRIHYFFLQLNGTAFKVHWVSSRYFAINLILSTPNRRAYTLFLLGHLSENSASNSQSNVLWENPYQALRDPEDMLSGKRCNHEFLRSVMTFLQV